jgi:hypothetical protein
MIKINSSIILLIKSKKTGIFYIVLLTYILLATNIFSAQNLKNQFNGEQYSKKQKELSEGMDINEQKYMTAQIKKDSIILTWDWNNIPEEEITWDPAFSRQNMFIDYATNTKVAGYLIYLYHKKSNYNPKEYIDPIYLPHGFDQYVYYTEKQCLFINGINMADDYFVVLRAVVEGNYRNETVIGIKKLYDLYENQFFTNINLKLFKHGVLNSKIVNCESQIVKVSLKELNKNKEKYTGTFIEIEGFFDRPIDLNLKTKAPITLVTETIEKSNSGITDNLYGINVVGWDSVDKSLLLKGREEKNYAKILVYFSKKTINPKEVFYNALIVSIVDLIKKDDGYKNPYWKYNNKNNF